MRRYITASTIACALCGVWWVRTFTVRAHAAPLACEDAKPEEVR
jgi:hypothetical protein